MSGTAPPPRWRAPLAEASGLVGTVAIAFVVLAGTTATHWRDFLLFNGDSLVMAMVAKSLGDAQPPIWSLSSQLFVYPEAPIYAVAWSATRSPAPSIAVSAILVITITYLLLRWCARHVLPAAARLWRPIVAAASLLPFMALCLLEWRASYNGPEIATLYLDMPYYCGVVIAGLLALCLMLETTRLAAGRPGLLTLLLVGTVVNAAAATFSDPLFLIQAAAPLLVTLLVLAILRRVGWVRLLLLLAALGAGSAVGWLVRPILAKGLVVSATSYAHLDQWRQSVTFLHLSLIDLISTPRGFIEVAIAAVLFVATAVVCVLHRHRLGMAGLAVGIFAMATDVCCLAGTIATGSLVTRYLIPATVVTSAMALTVSAAIILSPGAARRAVRGPASVAAAALLVASAVVAPVAVPPVVRGYQAEQHVQGLACLSRWVDGRDVTGAGSFWVTRPLNLYGGSDIDLIQVNFDFSAQAWMMNLAAFIHKDVSYFLVSDEAPWRKLVTKHLGAPASVVSCPGFQIWDYAGTPGETTLTAGIADSTAEYLRERTP
jgi:hypothetical protein